MFLTYKPFPINIKKNFYFNKNKKCTTVISGAFLLNH